MCTGLNCVKSDLAEKQDDVEEGGEEGEGDDGCEEEGGEESDRFDEGDGTGEGAESENQRAAAFVESNGYGDPEVVERRQGDERADREANGKAETDKQNTNDMSGAHLVSADSTVSQPPLVIPTLRPTISRITAELLTISCCLRLTACYAQLDFSQHGVRARERFFLTSLTACAVHE